jgi:hypothetical protein
MSLAGSRHGREAPCWNLGQLVSTATSSYGPIHLRRVSALTNVRFVPLVSTPSWETSVRTAVEVLCPGQSDHRRIGKAITILAGTQRAPRSNTDPLTLKLMRGSRRKSSQYRQRSGNPQQWIRRARPSTRACKGAVSLCFCTSVMVNVNVEREREQCRSRDCCSDLCCSMPR